MDKVIGISSFNRDNYYQEVNFSSFKESGAIEQDADVIILLYDALYENNKIKQDEKNDNVRHIEAIIAKNRNGQSGVANLLFLRNYSRYDAPSREWEEQYAKLQSEGVRYL